MDFLLFFWPWTLLVMISVIFLAWRVPRFLIRRKAMGYLRRLKKWQPAESAIVSYSRLMAIFLPLTEILGRHQKILEPVNIDWLYVKAQITEKAHQLVDYSRECVWKGCEDPQVILNNLKELTTRTGLPSLDIGHDHWPEWLKANLESRIDGRRRAIAAELNFLRLDLEAFDLDLSEQEKVRMLAGVESELDQGLEDLKTSFRTAGQVEKEPTRCSK